VTFDLEKVAYNLKTIGRIVKQFYMVLYVTWLCKSNTRGQMWPWPFKFILCCI